MRRSYFNTCPSLLCLPQGLCLCSSFCSEGFYHQVPPLHHSNLTQMSPSQGHLPPWPLKHPPFLSLITLFFFLLHHLYMLEMLIHWYLPYLHPPIHQIELSPLRPAGLFSSPLYPSCLEQDIVVQCRKEGLFVLAKCWAIIYLTKDLYPEYVFESFQTTTRRKQTTQYFKVAKDVKIYWWQISKWENVQCL